MGPESNDYYVSGGEVEAVLNFQLAMAKLGYRVTAIEVQRLIDTPKQEKISIRGVSGLVEYRRTR